jgi:hypothetical protein
MARDDKNATGIDRRNFLKLAGGVLGAAGIYAVLINVKVPLSSTPPRQAAGDYDPNEHYWGS